MYPTFPRALLIRARTLKKLEKLCIQRFLELCVLEILAKFAHSKSSKTLVFNVS